MICRERDEARGTGILAPRTRTVAVSSEPPQENHAVTVINSNTNALLAQRSLAQAERGATEAMEQLSSGRRINSASDDAAGLAISKQMTALISGMEQAVRNANDGISLVQTAEGALGQMSDIVQRMRELAVQAATETNSAEDRGYLDTEFQQLRAELDRIVDMTEFNGTNLLDKSAQGGLGVFTFQIGVGEGQTIQLEIPDFDTATSGGPLYLGSANLLSTDAAQQALSTMDDALSNVDSTRAAMGSTINRLTFAIDTLDNTRLNTEASRSAILDTDYAWAATELSRNQILQQAATAVLAQANVSSQMVMRLLEG
jgi:flagellin